MTQTIYHGDLEQGSPEWLQARCGLITASEVKLIMTPTNKPANNAKTRAHVYELAAQRITGHIEASYISDDMVRGMGDEVEARDIYSRENAPAQQCGFITRDIDGVTIGYSPDFIVGADGIGEIKSRRQKYQIQTIVTDEVPDEYMLQIQTGLLVTGRKWLDFVSYCEGLPIFVKRVTPDLDMQSAIRGAAKSIDDQIKDVIKKYHDNAAFFTPTQRRTYTDGEITL